MEKFYLEPTKISPLINFIPEDGLLELKGRSSPENPIVFFKPLYDVIDQYALNGSSKLKVNMELNYFNTSSSKCLYELLKKISVMTDLGKTVEVNWFYEEDDDDILEAGEDLESLLGINFNYVEI